MALSKRESQETTVAASSIILDIEGTTTPIHYVKDVLFSYIRSHLEEFINENWSSDDFQEHIKALKNQAQQDKDNNMEGVILIPEAVEESALKTAVIDNVKWQMDNDRKTKSLKDLQGLIMEKGFKKGDLKGQFYDDVERSLKSWVEQGKSVYIYSSGSIHAQKLFFGHSDKGDLLPFIKGHFDTSVGMKGDVSSYREILKQISRSPSETVFLTDIPKEAKAAKEAGILAILVSRMGNAPISDEDETEFQVITSFEDIEFESNFKKRKICSENTVNIENKDITCSLSIEEKTKPDIPQTPSNNEVKSIETDENSAEKPSAISIDSKINLDELMDVDENPSEENINDKVKTCVKDDDNKQEDSSTCNEKEKPVPLVGSNEVRDEIVNKSENKNEEIIKSDSKTSNSKTGNIGCNIEAKAVNSVIENNKEDVFMSNSVTSKKGEEDIKLGNECGKEELLVQHNEEAVKTDKLTESLKEEAATTSLKNDDEKVEHSEDIIKVANPISQESVYQEEELLTKNKEKMLVPSSDSEKNITPVIDKESLKREKDEDHVESDTTVIKPNEETENGREPEKKDNAESAHSGVNIEICNENGLEEKEKNMIEEKLLPNSNSDENFKSVIDKEALKLDGSHEHVKSEPSVVEKEDDSDKELNIKDNSESANSEENLSENNVSNTSEKSQTAKEICIKNDLKEKEGKIDSNGIKIDDLETESCSKEEIVETKINSMSVPENMANIKETDLLVEPANKTSITVDINKSPDYKKQSNVSEQCQTSVNQNESSSKEIDTSKECQTNTKLEESENTLLKPVDEMGCAAKSEKTLVNVDSNGLTHLDSTDAQNEVPLINKKTEDKISEVVDESESNMPDDKMLKAESQNGQISSENNQHSNGKSSPDLTKENGLADELPLVGKKGDASENPSVVTVIEA